MSNEVNYQSYVGQVIKLGPGFADISEVGHYGEPGMLARVTRVSEKRDFLDIEADFEEFREHNDALMTSDFFLGSSLDGKTGTAHEAGKYEPVSSFYVDFDCFENTISLAATGPEAPIMAAYEQREDKSQTYQQFIVASLLDAMEKGYDLGAADNAKGMNP